MATLVQSASLGENTGQWFSTEAAINGIISVGNSHWNLKIMKRKRKWSRGGDFSSSFVLGSEDSKQVCLLGFRTIVIAIASLSSRLSSFPLITVHHPSLLLVIASSSSSPSPSSSLSLSSRPPVHCHEKGWWLLDWYIFEWWWEKDMRNWCDECRVTDFFVKSNCRTDILPVWPIFPVLSN